MDLILLNKHNLEIKDDSILFFDLDGTLVNTNFANYLSYKKAISTVTQSDLCIYNPNERFNRKALKQTISNLTELEYEKIIGLKDVYYVECLPETEINQQVVNILLKYYKTHKTVLVTNCRRDRAFMTLKYHKLLDKFSHKFYRQRNGNINKYQNALIALKVSPISVLVFENEKSQINAAIAAGVLRKNTINISKV